MAVRTLSYILEAVPVRLGIEIYHCRKSLVEVHVNSSCSPLHANTVLGWDIVVKAAYDNIFRDSRTILQ